MTDKDILVQVRARARARAVRDANALRLVGAAVAVAATAKPLSRWPFKIGIREYTVPKAEMEALIGAARASGFEIPPLDGGGTMGKQKGDK